MSLFATDAVKLADTLTANVTRAPTGAMAALVNDLDRLLPDLDSENAKGVHRMAFIAAIGTESWDGEDAPGVWPEINPHDARDSLVMRQCFVLRLPVGLITELCGAVNDRLVVTPTAEGKSDASSESSATASPDGETPLTAPNASTG